VNTPAIGRTRKAVVRKAYLRERAKGNLSRIALFNAKTRIAWDKANGHVIGDGERVPCYEPAFRDVRLRIVADDCCDLENLLGDTYNPKVNTDIPESRLERERQQEIDRINRDGVWGVIGEYFDGEQWEHVDSCFGFVGQDWKDSGYDVDIMASTMDAARKARKCRACHRPVKVA
jgi:hypothetical protein